jgi:pimeloyl-ACP methyl ester carboxylesterase
MLDATLTKRPVSAPAPFLVPSRPPWPIPAEVSTATVNGYPMAYWERGAGETVVLVHGSLSDYRYWAPQFSSPPPGFRFVAVSLRHFYPEPRNGKGDDFSVQAHAADLAAFIDRLGVGPVQLVAWSRGGAVALGALKSRPDLVRKLMLMEPVISCLAPKAAGTGGPDPALARLEAAAAYYEKGDIDGGLRYFVDDLNGPGAWMRRTAEQRQLAHDNAWTLVRQVTDTDAVTPGDLQEMTVPVLLVGGENGPQYLAHTMGAAQKLFPSARRVTISNAGHRMNLDNPAEFNRVLAQFLSN